MLKYKLLTVFLVVLLITGCKNNTELKDFTYKYIMESAGNFKVEFEMNPDSTYKIVQNNYFFDRFEGESRPVKNEGVLTKPEFEEFSRLLQKSNLHKMKDSYGFSDDEGSDNSILYIVELIENGQSKFVSVNAGTQQNFSKEFTELIQFTNEFVNANLTE